MAHRYAKQARFVRKALLDERRWRRRPTYDWVLKLVERHIDDVRRTALSDREVNEMLLERIRPIAFLVASVEDKFRVPEHWR